MIVLTPSVLGLCIFLGMPKLLAAMRMFGNETLLWVLARNVDGREVNVVCQI